MKVFKFGGASVKSAEAIRNVAEIVRGYQADNLVIIISAMGKTTNAFEAILHSFFEKREDKFDLLSRIKDFHFRLVDELFADKSHKIYEELHNTFVEAEWQLEDDPIGTFDFEYDQLIGLGELLSTKIVSAYLNKVEIANSWVDARDVIRTDNNYRKANVEWLETEDLIVKRIDFEKNKIYVTQGFIGSSSENFTTTLGREGSDFSAAIFASCLNATEVVIWKDVDGMLNADPKFYNNTIKLNNISYKEAVELAYFGASVIHPKTIKPLQNKQIPLFVKSFINPSNKGTIINENSAEDSLVPSYIHKNKQALISISSKDYSFMDEVRLTSIFKFLADIGLGINVMQNSALSFSISVDNNEKVERFISSLKPEFNVSYNLDVTLITVRHYSEKILKDLLNSKTILLEQKTRSTARFVVIN